MSNDTHRQGYQPELASIPPTGGSNVTDGATLDVLISTVKLQNESIEILRKSVDALSEILEIHERQIKRLKERLLVQQLEASLEQINQSPERLRKTERTK